MATLRKRGLIWQVQVRRTGQPPISRSFNQKPDALAWARQIETEIDRRGLAPNRHELEQITVGDLLRKYRDEVVVNKRSRERENQYIGVLLRHKMARYALSHASPDVFRRFRDERLKSVKPATVRRQFSILQHAFNVAIKEWALPLRENPVAIISKPRLGASRERRLQDGELTKLLEGSQRGRLPWLSPVIQLAIETGMRRGELISIRWDNIELDSQTLHIPMSKNGYARTIPLTPSAVNIIDGMSRDSELVFPISGNAVRLAWQRLKKRVGVVDLHFHDLRHEAISRFFEMGLSVPEVALISGHRDIRMLFRYTHLKAEDVVKKLR
jgi:integrase